MNRHLNIFDPYTKSLRDNQLENDLTRALAICLQEDNVFLHAFLKSVLGKKTYSKLFSEASDGKIEIDIQQDVESISEFNKLYALSITGIPMNTDNFKGQKPSKEYNPITDLIIVINDIVIIGEVKPNDTDCTNQLYTQSYNAVRDSELKITDVTPVDMNWKKLMEIAVQTKNFEEASLKSARFIGDFIQFIRGHNHRWLPVSPFGSLADSITSVNAYKKRINSVLASISDKHEILEYSDRIGLKLNNGWAQEIVFNFHNYNGKNAAIGFGNLAWKY